MKKTLTINLGGVVFQIEDDAYYALDKYINALKRKFANDPDQKEIIEDIEQRIAEIFQQEMSNPQEAVTIAMVEKAKAMMGSADAIADEDEEQETRKKRSDKRFFRDRSRGVFGGVCAGLASYMNIDVIIIRIVFVLFLLASSGTFFFVYLVLWLAIPEAVSDTQRMEMKGEKVNVSSIEKHVKGKKQQPQSKKAPKKAQPKNGPSTGETMVKILAWIVIGFFIFIILTITLSLLAALFGLTIASSVLSGFLPEAFVPIHMNLSPDVMHHTTKSILGLILFIGSPVILILFVISKLAFKHNGKVGWVIFLSTVFWLIGIGLLASAGLRWVEQAAKMDIEVVGDDDRGALVIGGDTIVQFNEGHNNKVSLKVKTRKGKFELDEASNMVSFTTNISTQDTLFVGQPSKDYRTRSDFKKYVWVKPKYRIENADVEQVTLKVVLKDYPYRFENFKLKDPILPWSQQQNHLMLPDKVGMQSEQDGEHLPEVLVLVPEALMVTFENNADELFYNLDEEQKERIESGQFYRMKNEEFYLSK